MKDNNHIASIQNGRTLGSATPQGKDIMKVPASCNKGKGLGNVIPKKK